MLTVENINPKTGHSETVPLHTWTHFQSFGTPSGHAFSSMTIALALIIDYMQAKIIDDSEDSESRLSVGTGEERVNLEREALKQFPIC